ncbi:MAG: CPBP family intramembrane metalloprotease [Erysipelotrichaceae bacterium]|nr:CPBP family intramembrane metalloprotease [Erysipelotrichaceae bacterium]
MNETIKTDKSRIITVVGIVLMLAFILTNFTPYSGLVGYSILVGIAGFFIVEWVSKTPDSESGLRFKTFFADLKKCSPLLWLIIPVVSTIADMYLGTLLFDTRYVEHVMGRTDAILNFENMLILAGQFIIGALGEEIAFRGFFVGKGTKVFGFWPVAIVSSVFFALAHLASGNAAIVAYDLAGILFDAIIYSLIMRKTNNCLVSTLSHFLVNMLGMILVFAFIL